MAKRAKARKRERRERRFEPSSTTTAEVVYVIGAIGATAMGAGAWGQLAPLMRDGGPPAAKVALYLLATGAVLVGVALWLGTSGDPTLRVGDAGLCLDRGGLRRMPWYSVEKIEWRQESVIVTGTDEAGAALTITARLATHGQAAAWIVKEARERIPKVVDVPADANLPAPATGAGTVLSLGAAQVVGRRCAASGKVIDFEPHARTCPRCTRAYLVAHLPSECACGASLADLKAEAKTA